MCAKPCERKTSLNANWRKHFLQGNGNPEIASLRKGTVTEREEQTEYGRRVERANAFDLQGFKLKTN